MRDVKVAGGSGRVTVSTPRQTSSPETPALLAVVLYLTNTNCFSSNPADSLHSSSCRNTELNSRYYSNRVDQQAPKAGILFRLMFNDGVRIKGKTKNCRRQSVSKVYGTLEPRIKQDITQISRKCVAWNSMI